MNTEQDKSPSGGRSASSDDSYDSDDSDEIVDMIKTSMRLNSSLHRNLGTENEKIISDGSFSAREELNEMFSLGWPLAVSFFCRLGMAATDVAFIGHLNDGVNSAETFLAAFALSNLCMNILLVPPLGFNQVLSGLVGQAMGSESGAKMAGVWLQQSMFWLIFSSLPFLVGFYFVEPTLIGLGFSPHVSSLAGRYARYNVLWPIPNGLYQCMRFYFQALGHPKPAMYNGILFLFVNAILNYVFIYGVGDWQGMGFVGAAVSITVSRIGQTVIYFLYMFVYKKYHEETWPGIGLAHHTRARTNEFLRQALPAMATLLFQEFVVQVNIVLIGQLGEGAIAAYSVVDTVLLPCFGTLEVTMSMTSAVRVGMHLGAGDALSAKKTSSLIFYIVTAATVIASAILLPLRTHILKVATNDLNLLAFVATLLPAALVWQYFMVLVLNMTSGVLSGMGRPIISTWLSFFYEIPTRIGGVAILIYIFDTSLLSIFWMLCVATAIESVILLIIMVRSDWNQCAEEALKRQEASTSSDTEAGRARRRSSILDLSSTKPSLNEKRSSMRSSMYGGMLHSVTVNLPQDKGRASINSDQGINRRRGSIYNVPEDTVAVQIQTGRRRGSVMMSYQ